MILSYLFLAAAVFFTISLVSYLIHLNKRDDLPLPASKQLYDIVVYVLFSAFWAFVIWTFHHPLS